MTPMEINIRLITLGIITGIVFLIITIVLRYFLRKKALENIKNNLLEGEFIVYEPKFTFTMDYFIPFVVGVTLSGEMPYMPFIKPTTLQEFPVFLILDLFLIFIAFLLSSTKLVLTNKRMIYSSPFKFLFGLSSSLLQFDYLNYSDIKNFDYGKDIFAIWSKTFYVYTNNNEKFSLKFFNNKKDFQTIVEKYK